METCRASVVLRLANTSASESEASSVVVELLELLSVSVTTDPVSPSLEVLTIELSVSPLPVNVSQ